MLHIGYKHIQVDAPHEYHQSSLLLPDWTFFMKPAPDQVGWVSTIGELNYRLNPMSLDDSKITLLKRPLVNGSSKIFFKLYKVQDHNFAQ